MCLQFSKYYTNLRQHNLFILEYGYMFRLDLWDPIVDKASGKVTVGA